MFLNDTKNIKALTGAIALIAKTPGLLLWDWVQEDIMEIIRSGVAGTLESSDCQIMVEPGEGRIEFQLESTVINQYGNQIKKVVLEVLNRLDINDIRISIVDKGALDCTIKARVEGAVFRSVSQTESLPWGGAIR
jgi:citrate lyase subunit gamma (acyl carrier protein)